MTAELSPLVTITRIIGAMGLPDERIANTLAKLKALDATALRRVFADYTEMLKNPATRDAAKTFLNEAVIKLTGQIQPAQKGAVKD